MSARGREITAGTPCNLGFGFAQDNSSATPFFLVNGDCLVGVFGGVAVGIAQFEYAFKRSGDGAIYFVGGVPLRALVNAVEQNFKFDFAICESGVRFLKVGVIGDIAVNGLCGGGKIKTFCKLVVQFCPHLEFTVKRKEFMNISPNIENRDSIKGVFAFEPIATEIEYLFVKGGVVGIRSLDIESLKISTHLLCDVSKFFH